MAFLLILMLLILLSLCRHNGGLIHVIPLSMDSANTLPFIQKLDYDILPDVNLNMTDYYPSDGSLNN